jgi:hypothetical protein
VKAFEVPMFSKRANLICSVAAVSFVAVGLLSGCNQAMPGALSEGGTALKLQGTVHGGQQPVSGSTVRLYAVGTTSDGGAATSLLSQAVVSDANGNFGLTGLYTCPSANALVYITATGGNPGLGAGANNAALAMMTALGTCGSLTPSSYITINELTTVAAVFPLAPFMTSMSAVGASPADAASLAAAFNLAQSYVDPGTGQVPGPMLTTGVTDPIANLNTLADIAAACINSAGGASADGTQCGNLFLYTPALTGTAPADTVTALLNVAHNPTVNTGTLLALAPPSSPFQPQLASAPVDFTPALTAPGSFTVSSAAVNFPDTEQTVASAAMTVTLTNGTANAAPVAVPVVISGTNAAEYSSTTTCGASLGAGSSCTVSFVFTPSGAGPRTAFVTLTPAGSTTPRVVQLQGKGVAPTGLVTLTATTPSSVSSYNYILRNDRFTALQITSVSLNYSSSLLNTVVNCPSTLAPLAQCNINVYLIAGAGITSNVLTAIDSAGQQAVPVSFSVDLAVGNVSFPDTTLGTTVYGYLSYTSSGSTYTATIPAGGYDEFTVPYQIPSCNYHGGLCYGSISIAFRPLISGVRRGTAYVNGTAVPLQANGIGPNFISSVGYGQYDFGSHLLGTDTAVTFQVTNNGNAAGACPNFANTGSEADFTAVGSTTAQVPVGSTCAVTVHFIPAALGVRQGSIGVYAVPSVVAFGVQGTGIAGPYFSVGQSSLSLGIKYPSFDPHSYDNSTATLAITNTGTTAFQLGSAITGAGAGAFSFNGALCQTLAVGASCTAQVTYASSGIGSSNATLTLSDLNSTVTQAIPLTGQTTYWAPITSVSSMTFPLQAVGVTSASNPFSVVDANSYPLGHALSVSLPANSSFTLPLGSTCAASTTQTCQLSIAFAPTAVGTFIDTATVTDLVSGLTTTIALSGQAGGPVVSFNPGSLTFAAQAVNTTATPQSVVLTNTGTVNLVVSSVSLTGVVNANYTQINNCGTVTPNGTCTISVTFAPKVTGSQGATLHVVSNAPGSPSTLGISGSAQ